MSDPDHKLSARAQRHAVVMDRILELEDKGESLSDDDRVEMAALRSEGATIMKANREEFFARSAAQAASRPMAPVTFDGPEPSFEDGDSSFNEEEAEPGEVAGAVSTADAVGDIFNRILGVKDAAGLDLANLARRREERMRELNREDVAHKVSCREPFCGRCGRHACSRCRREYVDDYDQSCGDCLARDVVREMEVPRRYEGAKYGYGSEQALLATRVRSRTAITKAKTLTLEKSAVFVGASGQGKTTLMVAAACRAIAIAHRKAMPDTIRRRGRAAKVLFKSATELAIEKQQHPLGQGEADAVQAALDADVLLLDDVGFGPPSTWDSSVIMTLMSTRHNDDKVTWVSLGLTPEEVAARYSGGIERRIFEHAVLIDCDPPRIGGKR